MKIHLSVLIIGLFALLCSCSTLLAASRTMQIPDLIPPCPVSHITDAMLARDGTLWVIGEQASIYRLESGSVSASAWFNLQYLSDFPDTLDFRCIAQDLQGRIWVGTDNQGVAVCNGQGWKMYNRENALCGDHVVDIAVSPLSGEVALATSAGITIYNPADESWKDLTRADGLVSDQVESLAFARDGTLWLAYSCGGVACSTAKSGYSKWETTQSKWYWDKNQYVRQPSKDSGEGLPSNLCNAILPSGRGDILVGTCSGLGYRNRSGQWKYMRGNDYMDKNRGVYGARPAKNKTVDKDAPTLLNEDYITTLSESDQGIWVGFRRSGVALLDAKTYRVKARFKGSEKYPMPRPFVTAFVALPDGGMVCGTYGGGLVRIAKGSGSWQQEQLEVSPVFPKTRSSLTEAELAQQVSALSGLSKDKRTSTFWKEDWHTVGNWCGHYGNDCAILCGSNGKFGSVAFMSSNVTDNTTTQHLKIAARMGCHKNDQDGLRHWIHWLDAPGNQNVLWELRTCHRLEAEWDDHGEAYPRTHDGPDVWVAISLPKGIHAVSLYFFNPNGKNASESNRDYLLEVRQFSSKIPVQEIFHQDPLPDEKKDKREADIANILPFPVLARARVNNFAAHGVYKTFLLKGGCDYYIRVCRNNSFNTILNGVFVDLLYQENGAPYPRETNIYEFMDMKPEAPRISQETGSQFSEIMDLWKKTDSLVLSPSVLSQAANLKSQLYRCAIKSKATQDLISNWRWHLDMWNQQRVQQFEDHMHQLWYKKQDTKENLWRSSLVFKFSPRTIPLTEEELCVMGCWGIDWKQYLPDYQGTPNPTMKEFKARYSKLTKEDLQRLFAKRMQEYINQLQTNT